MKYIKSTYSNIRERTLASDRCKKFLVFTKLPELKVCKTAGFLASLIL